MGAGTSISWTDATWNPIRGCRRTAPAGSKQSGCGDPTGGGCYAERQAARFCGPGGAYEGLITLTANGPRWSGKTRFVREHLRDPLRWRKPRRIFTDSMSDLFYDGIDDWMIDEIVAVMMICCLADDRAGHTFQTLTKRPARMRAYFTDPKTQDRVARAAGQMMEDGDGWYDMIAFREEGLVHSSLWWGVSVENQEAADERVPELLETPAAVRFLSCEPLIGAVDVSEYLDAASAPCGETNAVVDWIIAGCESGPGARACDVDWLRGLRDQCSKASTPFFLKQAVGTVHDSHESRGLGAVETDKGSKRKAGGVIEAPYLDGVQHLAWPA